MFERKSERGRGRESAYVKECERERERQIGREREGERVSGCPCPLHPIFRIEVNRYIHTSECSMKVGLRVMAARIFA